VFPSESSREESDFWQGMGFKLEPAGQGWSEGTMRLSVTMLVFGESEEEAMRRFILKMRSIPKEEMDKYLCKHKYEHTMDCPFCSFKMEASCK